MSEISVLKNVRKDLNKMIKKYNNMLRKDGPDTEITIMIWVLLML